jgi:hypothetical protein
MALKRKITKEEFTKLGKDVQTEYTAKDDGYILDLDGDEDPDELRRARDREKQTAKDLRKANKAMQDELDELKAKVGDDTGDDKRKKDDIEKLERSWKDKQDKIAKEGAEKVAKANDFIRKTMVDGVAKTMAATISTAPSLMHRAIADRLTVDFADDEPVLKVLGTDGKASSMTIEQLQKEIVANKEYATILIGSKASGAGGPRNGPELKPGGTGASEKVADLSKMGGKDLAELIRSRRTTEA